MGTPHRVHPVRKPAQARAGRGSLHARLRQKVCRWFATLAEEENLWGIVGLIHDFDYDRWPSLDDHPYKGNAILKERGWPEVISRAVMSHAEYSGVTRDSLMEKALFACDELAGFITAVALIKPSKSLAEVDVKSVRKRMKDKAFARKVNRDDISTAQPPWASTSTNTSPSASKP